MAARESYVVHFFRQALRRRSPPPAQPPGALRRIFTIGFLIRWGARRLRLQQLSRRRRPPSQAMPGVRVLEEENVPETTAVVKAMER